MANHRERVAQVGGGTCLTGGSSGRRHRSRPPSLGEASSQLWERGRRASQRRLFHGGAGRDEEPTPALTGDRLLRSGTAPGTRSPLPRAGEGARPAGAFDDAQLQRTTGWQIPRKAASQRAFLCPNIGETAPLVDSAQNRRTKRGRPRGSSHSYFSAVMGLSEAARTAG